MENNIDKRMEGGWGSMKGCLVLPLPPTQEILDIQAHHAGTATLKLHRYLRQLKRSRACNTHWKTHWKN